MRKMLMALAITAIVAGCTDKEERAEAHYESALALLQDGDVTRAMLEMRNVLQNDGFHRDGRQLYADVLFEQGDMATAYGQYLRLVEQYPNSVDARRKLAEIAMDSGDWDEVRRHGRAALELEPDALAHKAIAVLLDYRAARAARDDIAAAQQVEAARGLLGQDPTLDTALRVMVDWLASGTAPGQALPYLNSLLDRHPGSMSLHMMRLRLLNAENQDDAVGAHLRLMAEHFPDDAEVGSLLLQWHIAKGQLDVAEADLRRRAGPDNGPFGAHLNVVALVEQSRGADAALEELDRLASANDGTDLGRRYALYAAERRFAEAPEPSMAIVDGLMDQFDDSDLRNEGRFILSRMYDRTGESAGAQALIATILEADPTHVPALIVRGASLLDSGDIDTGVVVLRQALNQDPRNTDTLVLLAKAQQRLGNAELAEQRLAQALEVSNGAEDIAILFAQFQAARGNNSTAILILTESFRADPARLRAAAHLAEMLMDKGDVGGARALLTELEATKDPGADGLVRQLTAAILFRENRIEDSLNTLRASLDGQGSRDLDAELQVLRVVILSQRMAEARTHLDSLKDRFGERASFDEIEANMLALEGRTDEAVAAFERLMAEYPNDARFARRLYTLLNEAGRGDEADAHLATSLQTYPDDTGLRILSALALERNGDISAALAKYEALHAALPSNLTVANNYASLLAYYVEDDASLALARQVSAPLTGLMVPAYLDTLGYIDLREGHPDAAIRKFETAARRLPQNATIAFNLGLAYAAAGQSEAARTELERGLALAGDAGPVPQMDRAKAALSALNQN